MQTLPFDRHLLITFATEAMCLLHVNHNSLTDQSGVRSDQQYQKPIFSSCCISLSQPLFQVCACLYRGGVFRQLAYI